MNFKALGIPIGVLLGLVLIILIFGGEYILENKQQVGTEVSETDMQKMEVELIDSTQLLELVADSDSEVVLVNMWATWCKPCVEEMPYLLKLRETYSPEDFELILVSTDLDIDMDRVKTFLASMEVDFKTYLKDEKDDPFVTAMSSEWSGALPATFIYKSGELKDFWMGDVSYDDFVAAVERARGVD